MHRVGGAAVVAVAEDFEAGAVVGLDEREGKVANGVVAQVGRHQAEADFGASGADGGSVERGAGDWRAGGLGIDGAAPDAVGFEEQAAIGVGADLGHLVVQGADEAGFGPVAGEGGERADGGGGVEVAGAVEDGGDAAGVRQEGAAEGQAAAGYGIGFLDVGGFAGAAGAVEAVGEFGQRSGVGGFEANGFTKIGVCGGAVAVDDAAGELEGHPGGAGEAGQEGLGKSQRIGGAAGAAQEREFGFAQRAGIGGAGEGLVEQRGSFGGVGKIVEQGDAVDPGAGVLGLEAPRGGEGGEGGFGLAGEAQGGAEEAVPFGVGGLAGDGALELADGGGGVAAGEVDVAAVDGGREAGGGKGFGGVENGEGFIEAAEVFEDDAVEVGEVENAGGEGDALFDSAEGFVEPAGLKEQDGEVVKQGGGRGGLGGAGRDGVGGSGQDGDGGGTGRAECIGAGCIGAWFVGVEDGAHRAVLLLDGTRSNANRTWCRDISVLPPVHAGWLWRIGMVSPDGIKWLMLPGLCRPAVGERRRG